MRRNKLQNLISCAFYKINLKEIGNLFVNFALFLHTYTNKKVLLHSYAYEVAYVSINFKILSLPGFGTLTSFKISHLISSELINTLLFLILRL